MSMISIAEASWQLGLLFFIQSTILMVVALIIVRLCRVRDAAVLSVVYRFTMIAVLVSPLLTITMKHSHVDGWWPAGPSQQTVASTQATVPTQLPLPQTDFTSIANNTSLEPEEPKAFDEGRLLANIDNLQQRESFPVESGRDELKPSEPALDLDEAAVAGNAVIIGKGIAAAIWLVVSVCLLTRHFRAYRALKKSLAASVAVSDEVQWLCDKMANELGVKAPRVVCSPYFESPFLTGIRNPIIHLSSDEDGLMQDITGGNIRDVLVHELAHLKRHDLLVRMMNHAALSLFFFQPLLWKLVGLIEGTAEDVCDDYAVGLGASREQYAQRLVDLAQRCDFPLGSAVGIASGNSMLKHRVIRIMDSGRSLSMRTGVRARILTAMLSVVAVLIASLSFTPAAIVAAQLPVESAISDGNTEIASEQSHVPTPIEKHSTDDVPLDVIRGTVLGSEGPLAGAEVYWWRSRVGDDAPMQPVRVVTDQDGKFELKRTPPTPDQVAIWDMREEMIVRAKGYAFERTWPRKFGAVVPIDPDWPGQHDPLPRSSEPIKLAREGSNVSGRLIDIEGQPIVGASVRICCFSKRSFKKNGGLPNLSPAEPEPDTDEDLIRDVASVVNSIEQVPFRDALPMGTTNSEGRFDLNELPADCFFELLVEHQGFESTNLVVRNDEENEIVMVPQAPPFEDNPPTGLYPPKFEAVIGPSSTVIGTVTDADTGLPIVGALVQTCLVNNQRITSTWERQHWAERTDARGRYRIAGLPAGAGNQFVVHGPRDLPYIPVTATTSESSSELPDDGVYKINFQLKQGIWAEGRAYDAKTGVPFQGKIAYYWFPNRELEAKHPGSLRAYTDGRNFTDSDGRYRIPVLPTAGVIAFSTGNRDQKRMSVYSRGYGEFELTRYRSEGIWPLYRTEPRIMAPGDYQRVALVEPKPGERVVNVDLSIGEAIPIPVTILNPDEKPVTEALEIYGGNEGWWHDKTPQGFVVEDLLPDQRRKVFAFDRSRDLIGGTIVDHGEGKQFTIELSAAGRVHGRLVAESGEPITDAIISAVYGDAEPDNESATWAWVEGKQFQPHEIQVDDDGRFAIRGLSPEWKYSARVVIDNRIVGRAFRSLVIKPGEDRDLGNITIGNPDEVTSD
ncbi:M56 family metallopeptidase [Novipirellula sp.]|uniref:M56 family metallopeptidase n=1 Tax=Novipirellula sp. TaxID=2795430 RepID=UPI003566F9D7